MYTHKPLPREHSSGEEARISHICHGRCLMKNRQSGESSNTPQESKGRSWELIVLLTVIIVGLLGLIVKALGVF